MKPSALIFLLFAFISTHGASAQTEVGVTDTKIILGTSFPFEGPISSRSKELFRASDMVFQKVNAHGGINGRQIEFIKYNDKYKPEITVENAKKLIEKDKVFGLFQVFGAPANRSLAPWLRKENIFYFAPGTGGSEVREPVIPGTFNLRVGFAEEVENVINFLYDKKGVRDFALLYQDDALGFGTRSGAQKALAAKNLKLKEEAPIPVGDSKAAEAAFEKITASGAKAVILGINFAPAAVFVKKAAKEKKELIFAGTTSVVVADFIKATSGAADGAVFATAFPPLDTPIELLNSFKADLKEAKITEPAGIEGYIDALVFVEALKRAGKNLTKASMIKALESMKDEDFGGIKVSFSPVNHNGINKTYLLTVKNGKFEVLRD